jgi:hypothetical protein
MKTYLVATLVALAPFSASAFDELDVGARTGTFAASAPIRNPELHPSVLLKVGSWRQDRVDDAHRRASLQPYVISNVRIENVSRFAVKNVQVACARSADELMANTQGDFSVPGIIRPRGSVTLGAIEVDLPASGGGTDNICRVVAFTPFYPGSPRNEVKEPPPPNVLINITR